MMTQREIERTERQIEAMNRLAEALETFNRLNGPPAQFAEAFNKLESLVAAFRRGTEEFTRAVSRIPTTIRTRF